MNKTKTKISYSVEYYDPQDKRWYFGGACDNSLGAFKRFLKYRSENYTCRMSKVESTTEILEHYKRKPLGYLVSIGGNDE